MDTKNNIKKAMKKLVDACPNASVNICMDMWMMKHIGRIECYYKAYTDTPEPTHGDSCKDSMSAVDSLLAQLAKRSRA